MNRRHLPYLAGLACALALAVACLLQDWSQHALRIENASGQPVLDLQVTVSSTHTTITRLPEGAHLRLGFVVDRDSAYHIRGRLQDGTAFDRRFGYVTPGVPHYRARAVIGAGGTVDGHALW